MAAKLRSKAELEKETAEKTDEELKRELQLMFVFSTHVELNLYAGR